MLAVNKHVAVIGGGCAGLSAAAALVESGFKVTLFEASHELGGRARTVSVENNSLTHLLDNGQHILLGAYSATLKLLHKVGLDEEKAFMRLPLQINMQAAGNKTIFSLKSASFLSSPLDMLVGLISCKGLSISEKMAAIKIMLAMRSCHFKITGDKALEQYLIEHNQPVKLIQCLWEPLCLAALNTPISIASTQVFLNVLKDSFAAGKLSTQKKNSDFLLPRADLSKILANPIAQYLKANGAQIKLNSRVSQLQVEGDGFSLTSREGKEYFSHVVLATPAASLSKLLTFNPKLQNEYQHVQHYSYQPIYTIYLQYPPDFKLANVMSGLTGKLGQWVFDRGQLCEQKGLLAVIVSATGKHQNLTQDELALSISNELHEAFPNMPKPLWHKVIAEKRATFSCELNLARPANKTEQARLFLAGDYTYADYPATIEGAIRSGLACANLIAND